jgi:translation initiation factor 5B
LDLIRQRQKDRENAELEAETEAKRIQRLQEEDDRKQEEKLRLEQAYRDKRKEKERKRIQRLREEGLYLTKEQRKKYQRAQIQLGAAGIEVPTRHTTQLTTVNTDESGRKRILYEDQRKANRTCMFFNLFLIS